MDQTEHTVVFRVRYGETDQMGTFDNAVALTWFEHGRTEMLRSLGIPYAEMEAAGVFLPVVEAHVFYRSRARYDDELRMTVRGATMGSVRVRCDVRIEQAETGRLVVEGHTVHAFVDREGRPMRPPARFADPLGGAR